MPLQCGIIIVPLAEAYFFASLKEQENASAAAFASQPEYAGEGGTGEIRPLRKTQAVRLYLREQASNVFGKVSEKVNILLPASEEQDV